MAVYGNDDFSGVDGDAPNPAFWDENAALSVLSAADGVSEISGNQLKQFASSTSGRHANVRTNYKLIGNFQFTVDLDFSQHSSTAQRSFIYLYMDSNNYGFFGAYGDDYAANFWVSGSPGTTGIMSNNDTVATLRVTRTGSSLKLEKYDNGYFWQTMWTRTVPTDDIWTYLTFRDITYTTTYCLWDNFTVVYADGFDGVGGTAGFTLNDAPGVETVSSFQSAPSGMVFGATAGVNFEKQVGGSAGFVLSAVAGGGLVRNANGQAGILFGATAGALNLTKWMAQYGDLLLIYRYHARMTGAADGLEDYDLSGLKSLQLRMRTGEPSYLALSIVYTAAAAAAIAARPNGEIVVDMAAVDEGEEVLREELIRVDYYSDRTDRGGNSQSITLVGYRTRTYLSPSVVALKGVKTETVMADGRRQYRCAKPDFYLRPGDTAVYGSDEMTVGSIVCMLSPTRQYVDVVEAG
ncbi:hypothetical protein DSCW_08860 [Desulfosarcina widdelii]|uniref:Uncharacterized protein n=1 Tax=Desulfosarcina widdelii TaxID=947919 RepID=A0A5K7YZN5_9BACT|nr:hypothetical protein [Desulfosarcina widdelii]BBO73469.1 hypothetical protein DSCW_08860 [Desulfosarcina widdelii]